MALVETFSGIRGEYEKELTEEIIKRYGYSFFLYLKENVGDGRKLKIVIGRDSRPSSLLVKNFLLEVLDCEIIDVGMLGTPLIENAVRDFGCDGGVIITASHNEPGDNGFKFLDKNGEILDSSSMEFLINKKNEIRIDDFKVSLDNQSVRDSKNEAVNYYKEFVKKIIGEGVFGKNKILVDPNGGSGIISKEIFEDYNINAEYINMNEGEFVRLVEPTLKSMSYLVEKIKKGLFDFAIGFDCDADRVEIILKNGELVSGNHVLAIITDYILSKSPKGSSVVCNDATSYNVKEIVEKNKGNFVEVEVGETNVINKMQELKSPIGGEGSNGGIIIPPSTCRDGILTTIYLLKILNERGKSLIEILKEIPEYFYFKEKIKLKDDFSNIRDKLIKYYKEKEFIISLSGGETGGIKVINNGDGSWVWFRQSKTEDKILRIISDSKDEKVAVNLLNEAKSVFDSI
ncbi:hypothetical protein GOV12_02890 [Candidatus Pacearchaeota archaeon]|nr:hypothetical protein [Candidatus Pacearchaeota archaeon]